jgi:regulator of protease activity HflC (stomatin/prohibitin superfamily)
VELVDLRLQTMEVAGQEILTRDKVSLRVNLTALWQVLDAVQARTRLVNFVEYVYKELQFALREAVGARTLDELLGDKGAFDREEKIDKLTVFGGLEGVLKDVVRIQVPCA